MTYSRILVSIWIISCNAALNSISSLQGIEYPAIVYTKGTNTQSFDTLFTTTVSETLITIYGAENTPFLCKLYFLSPGTSEYRPRLEYYRTATEKVSYDEDFIHQDMVNFIVRHMEKFIVKIDTTEKMTKFKENNYAFLVFFSNNVIDGNNVDARTLSNLGAVFDNILIACSYEQSVLTQEGVTPNPNLLLLYRESEPPLAYTQGWPLSYDSLVFYNINNPKSMHGLKKNPISMQLISLKMLRKSCSIETGTSYTFCIHNIPIKRQELKIFKTLSYQYKNDVLFCFSVKAESNMFYNSLAYYLGQNNAVSFPQVVFTKKRVKYYYDQSPDKFGPITESSLITFINDIKKDIPTTPIFYKSELIPTYQSSIVEKVVGLNYKQICIDSYGTTCVIYCRRHTCYDFISIYEAVGKKTTIKLYYLDLDFNEIADFALLPEERQRFICYKQGSKNVGNEFKGTFDEPSLTAFVATQTSRLLDL